MTKDELIEAINSIPKEERELMKLKPEFEVFEIEEEDTLNKRIKIGSKVKYLGESNWAYENGKIYEVVGYDEELEAYAVLSDAFNNAYCVAPEDLEEI